MFVSLVLSDRQGSPFPEMPASCEPVTLCQYEPAVSLSDKKLQI